MHLPAVLIAQPFFGCDLADTQYGQEAMYLEKNLANSLDFGKNDVNKIFTIRNGKTNRFIQPSRGYPERTLLIIKRNGDLIIQKH